MRNAIVLLSGGYHSAATMLLARTSQEFRLVGAVHVALERAHAEGYKAARRLSDGYGLPCELSPATAYGLGWLGDMLSQAAGIGSRYGAHDIFLGLSDPDARADLSRYEAMLRVRKELPRLTFHAPLLGASPDLPFGMAMDLGGLERLVADTHDCTTASREVHSWGHGCGACPSCERRRDGWAAFAAQDRLLA